MTLAGLDAWLSAPTDDDGAWYGVSSDDRFPSRPRRNDRTPDLAHNAASDPMHHAARQLECVRNGDISVFEALFFECAAPLRRFVTSMLHSAAGADDVVQDVFAQLWEQRETVEIKSSLRAYLFAAARGRALTALRAAGVREAYAARSVTDDVFVVSARTPDALSGIERDELTHALGDALASLPPRVRQAAELRWFGKLTHAEVAAVMGTSPATVNNQLTAALRTLRERLAPYRE